MKGDEEQTLLGQSRVQNDGREDNAGGVRKRSRG